MSDHGWAFRWAAPANVLVQAAIGAEALLCLVIERLGDRREGVTLVLGTF